MIHMKQETMTSRQRVLTALAHQEPDRMPIDLGMHFSTGISAFAYYRLREYLGLSTEHIEIVDPVQFLARVDQDVLERLHCDCIVLRPHHVHPHIFTPRIPYSFEIPHTMQPEHQADGWHCTGPDGKKMRLPENGYFFDGDWPDFTDQDEEAYLETTAREAERIYWDTGYFTMYQSLHAFFDQSVDMMIRMLDDPDGLIEENEYVLKRELERAGKIINRMGETIQGICLGADLGSQQGPLISPALYEEIFAPFLKKLCSFIHENSDYHIFYHCCGSIRPFLPILIDCGIDIINPVQHTAINMDAAELKQTFGEKLTFWGGGIDTQHVLPAGNEADIRADVQKYCNIFKPNGGFVFNPIHNIMGDVAPEHILTLYDEAYKNSFYANRG